MEVTLLDFDYTVYPGDCLFDFYVYCLQRKPQIIRFLPRQAWHWVGYMSGLENRAKGRSGQLSFLLGIDDVDTYVQAFWQKNRHKIRSFGTDEQQKVGRIIVSASPEFLLAPVVKQMRAHSLVATKVDKQSGRLLSKDCYGPEKVSRLRTDVGTMTVREAYSDSLSDLPMLQLADRAYIVRRHKIIPLEQYRGIPLLHRLFV